MYISLAFKYTASAHTGTNKHADEASFLVSAFQFAEQSANHAGTGTAKRMTQSNSTTTGVQLLSRYTKFVNRVSSLRSESLVDFKDINLVHFGTSLLEGSWDGISWADTHNSGRHTSNGERKNTANDFATEFLSDVTTAEKNASSTIRNLTGIASSSRATLLESGLQF